MQTKNLQNGGGRMIITVIVVVVVVAALGFVTWNKFYKSDDTAPAKSTSGSNSRDGETGKTEKDASFYDLSFKTSVKTDKQGDCHLSMKNSTGKEVLTQDNSTKNKKGQVGCEEWKLDTSELPAGDYKAVVTFKGGGDKSTSTSTIPIK